MGTKFNPDHLKAAGFKEFNGIWQKDEKSQKLPDVPSTYRPETIAQAAPIVPPNEKPVRKPLKVGRKRPQHILGRMNKLEAAYAEHLELQRRNSEIIGFEFERIKLRLADNTHYTPDFAVYAKDGTLEFHETKGFLMDDAAVKIKVAADIFPFRFVMVRKTKQGWSFTEYSDGW